MSDTKYTYAVARIRALEVSLFSSSTIEQLIACKDHESCLRFLTEHGWGGVDAVSYTHLKQFQIDFREKVPDCGPGTPYTG